MRAASTWQDIGDNAHARLLIDHPARVHRLVEPDVTLGDQDIETWETMLFVYPDEIAHNAEALVVDQFARIFILSKDADGTFSLFGAPFTANEEAVTLRAYGHFDISDLPAGEEEEVTAADFDPMTGRLIVRTYTSMLEYALPPGADLRQLEGEEPRLVPVEDERQGEAVTYGDGGYFHVTEAGNPPIYFVGCEG